MKLLIDIPKEKYEWIKTHNLNIDNDSIVGAVANGMPYEERPRGEWEITRETDEFYGRVLKCTHCGKEVLACGCRNFCTWCGAAMR